MNTQNCYEFMPGPLGTFICYSVSSASSTAREAANSLIDHPVAAAIAQSFQDLHTTYGSSNILLTYSLAAGAGIILSKHPSVPLTGIALPLSGIGILFGDDKVQAVASIIFSVILFANLKVHTTAKNNQMEPHK